MDAINDSDDAATERPYSASVPSITHENTFEHKSAESKKPVRSYTPQQQEVFFQALRVMLARAESEFTNAETAQSIKILVAALLNEDLCSQNRDATRNAKYKFVELTFEATAGLEKSDLLDFLRFGEFLIHEMRTGELFEGVALEEKPDLGLLNTMEEAWYTDMGDEAEEDIMEKEAQVHGMVVEQMESGHFRFAKP